MKLTKWNHFQDTIASYNIKITNERLLDSSEVKKKISLEHIEKTPFT